MTVRFITSDEVVNREGHFVPTSTINSNNSGLNSLVRFINSDDIFNVHIPDGDEMKLINFLFPCRPQEIQQKDLTFV